MVELIWELTVEGFFPECLQKMPVDGGDPEEKRGTVVKVDGGCLHCVAGIGFGSGGLHYCYTVQPQYVSSSYLASVRIGLQVGFCMYRITSRLLCVSNYK